ncbi:hypothetical protein OIU79_021841 [Salix purpurea]|uniref:Uncharacterized protein n=1 Tax=Salix purpurea TaxID=77065 RepID=A0A9Q1AC77_SALPP|nr:hypothetical protein OIU79_021841 [Salix purpurea]
MLFGISVVNSSPGLRAYVTCYVEIDEYKDPERYPCLGTCKNTIGNYKRYCPVSKYGDGKTGCQVFGIITIICGSCPLHFLKRQQKPLLPLSHPQPHRKEASGTV